MKKIVFLAVLMIAMAVGAFAQSYTVQNVSGRVQRESGGSRVDVSAGDTLSADTVIHTGVGASLILKEGDRSFTVPGARSGKVGELAAATSMVRIGGSIATTDTSAVSRTTGQTSTASARASEAAQDEDIAAE